MFLSLSHPPLIPITSSLRPQNPKSTPKSSQSPIQRIAEKLRNLGHLPSTPLLPQSLPPSGPKTPGEIFIPTPHHLPIYRIGHTLDPSWSTPQNPIPTPASDTDVVKLRNLWRKERRSYRENAPSVAELTVGPDELRRLRSEGIRIRKRLKVGKAGVTEGIVNGIHERWRNAELVKLKCEDLCKMNMRRTHETLERKTGGLVIWRSGSTIILYRGVDYKYPYFIAGDESNENTDESSESDSDCEEKQDESSFASSPSTSSAVLDTRVRLPLVAGVGSPNKFRLQLEGEVRLVEEADKLLDGLGPRFTDWWGCDPLPVDADLLPATVPGFRKPFRLLPFGVKPILTDREMTILRRLARPLPCHFALGRNRNLKGLAVSIIKLWEKCEIAKIAIKRNVQNMNCEMMANELKILTGGTLLSRDKEFIVIYRGKDFLPPAVSAAIEERREMIKDKLEVATTSTLPLFDGTQRDDKSEDQDEMGKASALERKIISTNKTIQRTESMLLQAIEQKEKAEKLLSELENSVEPLKVEPDKEGISEEERYMLRKVGLRMKPFLLLGRRGVFDGTIENMHLHWKYRELVKLISKEHRIKEVETAARILEAQSGGILVAVERVSKGYAIIIYRGKNYQRPSNLRPRALLNKKEAMKRSLEAQRHQSLKLHVLNLSRNIDKLKNQKAKNELLADPVVQSNIERTTEDSKETPYLDIEENDFANSEEVHQADPEPLNSEEGFHTMSGSIRTGDARSLANRVDLPSKLILGQAQLSRSVDTTAHYHYGDTDAGIEKVEIKSNVSSTKSKLDDTDVPFRASPLSNRERLILRKQALNMRKRPVIAVGRNNVLTGVAKTIKAHFKKYPLAIVNIKGCATGTSVQELIFELEEATGAVLVSREPNKVILYRGWGDGEAPGGMKGGDVETVRTAKVSTEVSSELMAAIRLECGLHAE